MNAVSICAALFCRCSRETVAKRWQPPFRCHALTVATAANVAAIVRANVHRESRLHTDESRLYPTVGKEFAAHETVRHTAKEYARGDVTTNTVETCFSVFKRGMRGIYQRCKEKRLHRYLTEFDFSFNTLTASALPMGNVRCCPLRMLRASVSRTANLTELISGFRRSGFFAGGIKTIELRIGINAHLYT